MMKKMLLCPLGIMMALSLAACSNTPQTTVTTAPASTAESTGGEMSGAADSASQPAVDPAGEDAARETAAGEGAAGEDGASQTPESLTVTTLNGSDEAIDIQVPYNPSRVAVLDMAVLDMLDNWDLGGRVVGMPKSSSIDYLMDYNNNEDIANLGTLKEVDMEALMSSEPEIIFIGGRLSAQYDALSKIAPVVYLSNNYEIGILQSMKNNVSSIASIFGVQDEAAAQIAGFDQRIAALAAAAEGKTAVIGMVTSSNFNSLGDGSRCSLIGNEIGFKNLANNVDSTHGNESSFELLVDLNPDYIFVLDRDSAINTEGAKLANEIMDNELVHKTAASQSGNIIYLTPTVWYLAEGGITAMDIMLQDLETGILGR